MKTDDLESELRNLKFTHLTESELVAFCDQELDQIGRIRAEAHLKQCFICKRRVALLLEETEALAQGQVSAEDVALVERLIAAQAGLKPTVIDLSPLSGRGTAPRTPSAETKKVPLRDRLTEYLGLMAASLQIAFKPIRGKPIWSWRSPDGRLQAHATFENADMIIHFSSTEMELEGARLHFRLGALNRTTTLRRVSESEVAAQVAVPLRQRPLDTPDISIEIV